MVFRMIAGSALASLVMLAGCSVSTKHDLRVSKAATISRIDRPLAVDIENYRGSVEVEVVPGLTQPTLRAWVLDESKQFMRLTDDATVKSWYAAEVAVVQGRPVLRIMTTRDAKTKPSSVRLLVQTPTAEGIRVRNSGGSVILRGVGGEITVENGYKGGEGGDIRVTTTRRISEAMNLRTTAGDVSILVPTNSQGRLEINTPKGEPQVNVRGDGLDMVKKTLTTFGATLNGGTKVWNFLNAEGDVRVEVGGWEPTTGAGPL
jgi:outer membrane murein-binding lipoprotein Lpp